uniref:Uncharacterized protein n=1 Tax=Anopheles maculatus TaxID=74869 RepID=A0A182SQ25_9DIPT
MNKYVCFISHSSITSRCTAPTSSSDCQHILDRSFSSQRYNNPQWYGTNTHATNLSNGCHGSGTYPGGTGLQRCLSTSQFMNGGLNLSSGGIGPNATATTTSAGQPGGRLLGNSQSLDNPASGTGHSYHSQFCGQGAGQPHGRLHKSLSFAFQTPMFTDDPIHHTCHQVSGYAADYPPPSRCYSRFSIPRFYGQQANEDEIMRKYPSHNLVLGRLCSGPVLNRSISKDQKHFPTGPEGVSPQKQAQLAAGGTSRRRRLSFESFNDRDDKLLVANTISFINADCTKRRKVNGFVAHRLPPFAKLYIVRCYSHLPACGKVPSIII